MINGLVNYHLLLGLSKRFYAIIIGPCPDRLSRYGARINEYTGAASRSVHDRAHGCGIMRFHEHSYIVYPPFITPADSFIRGDKLLFTTLLLIGSRRRRITTEFSLALIYLRESRGCTTSSPQPLLVNWYSNALKFMFSVKPCMRCNGRVRINGVSPVKTGKKTKKK